ncbi:hypothetical protein [Bacillus sp. FJAT-27264]|uniref:hypothetical protein n=1 Tax=Paenibacillus sp. (strain DSM 101736 / FJAT-27264) TaxID=1850362 RepID=UPI001111E8E5|nr:hypothetical protein [Bacillus sp. FJAT-27264]
MLFLLFGVIVYTPEFLGKNSEPGPIKQLLDTPVKLSLLLMILVFIALVYMFLTIAAFMTKKIIKHRDENDILSRDIGEFEMLKEKLEQFKVELKNCDEEKRIISEKLDQQLKNNSQNKQDEDVIKRIINILPVERMTYFTKKLSFGNNFEYSYIEMIEGYLRTIENPTYIFNNIYLEEQRNMLAIKLRELIMELFLHLDKVDSVRDIWTISPSLKARNPSEYNDIVNTANDLATEAGKVYDNIIKHSRKNLGMDIT